jgi:hypothetical protein
VTCTGRSDTASRPAHLSATLRAWMLIPLFRAGSDGLHVAQSSRLWTVTTRLIDVLRYQELSSESQARKGQPITPEQLTVVPANEAS